MVSAVRDRVATRPPPARLARLAIGAALTKVASLDSDLTQVLSVLRDIDQHVASIDKKTGPGLPLH
jgi:hypothetical protein